MSFGPIETERLILRDWRPDDLDAVARMASDPDWAEFIFPGGTPQTTRAEAWRGLAMFVGHRVLRGYTMFVVEEKETGEFVGRVGPWMPEGWPHLEIGWGIDRSRWGRGYAIEAARAAAGWVHAELGADTVIHLIDPRNERSIRVARKLGAVRDGTFVIPPPANVHVDVWRTKLPLGP
jgi:RimJ/RimL family protein N-acetyltransferase